MTLPRETCKHCGKQMVEVFCREEPYYLEGWSCDCSHSEPALLREKKFTRTHYEDQEKDQAGSGGHMVQQSGEVA